MFNIMHTDGSGEVNPPVESFSDLYDELLTSDEEHGEVSVLHEDSGWCLAAHRNDLLVVEQLREGAFARHMIPVPKDHVLELWKLLIAGDIDRLLAESWKPGYGTGDTRTRTE